MATVITFPGTIAPPHGARLPAIGTKADKSAARGSLAWAKGVIVTRERLSHAIAEARRASKERRQVEFPKPVFVPDGKGYDSFTAPQARAIVLEKMPDFGPEDRKLVLALKAYDAERKRWEAATERFEEEAGLYRLRAQADAMYEDHALAMQIVRENREEQYR